MRTPLIILTVCAAALAQDAPPTSKTPVLNAAVSGTVRDKNTGKPLADYMVSTYIGVTWVGNTVVIPAGSKDVKATTDESGHYRISDLPPGPYRIMARNSHGRITGVTKHIALNGHDIEDLNFDFVVPGTIKGKILDENKEPIPDIMVSVISREYFLGSTGYFFTPGSASTNDRGEFTLTDIEAGRAYLLVAEPRPLQIPAHSNVPLNPKLRRRIATRTWYPNSPARDGAAPITLQPAEIREGIVIEMKKSPSYCAEGTLLTGSGGPGALRFSLEAQQPSSGVSEGGGLFRAAPSGSTGADGAFRFCDLSPGTYRITAMQTKGDLLYGVSTINIADRDIAGLKIAALPTQPIEGEVVLDGPVPANPLPRKVSLSLQPLLRTIMPGELPGGIRADIPSTFTIPGVTPDDYFIRPFIDGPDLYIKDIQWAGISIKYQALRPAASSGTGLRVVIGQDGATLSATVSAKDGNPASDIKVIVLPAQISSEAILSAAMVYGQTDQAGKFTSQPLAPGAYYVGAVDTSIDHTTDFIARLWRSRARFTEIDVAPKAVAQITLEPIALAP
jgi:hypothetical protein